MGKFTSKGLTSLDWASLVLAVALLVCLLPLPYGFYTVIRLAVAIVVGCWAYQFYEAKRIVLAIIAFGVVLIFQPFLKVVLDRLTWNILDVILAMCLIVLSGRKFFRG